MSGARKSTSRRGRSRGSSTPVMKDFVRKSDIKGMKVSPSSNPPDLTIQPWYPYVILDTYNSSFNYTVNDIASYFRKRIDPCGWGLNFTDMKATSKPFRMQMRIQSVSAWNLTGKFITLSVEDFHDTQSAKGGRDQLCGLIDSGTNLHTPAVGYRLPLNCRNTVLRNDDTEGGVYVFHSQAAEGDTCLVHIHILWRFDGPVAPPKLTAPSLYSIGEQISSYTPSFESLKKGLDSLNNIAMSLKEISEENQKKQPGVVKRVVDGISQLAVIVASVSEGDDLSLLSDADDALSKLTL